MQIVVGAGAGEGPTALAAFDAALQQSGLADYNLVVLSSVIPPGAEVVQGPPPSRQDEWGNRLYVVMAERRETRPGCEAWAGLGWTQQPDGRGLFVEHYGGSQAEVEAAIHSSLGDMVERRSGSWSELRLVTVGKRCQDRPVCALVAAAYRSESW